MPALIHLDFDKREIALTEVQIVDIVDAGMIYPTYKSMKNKELSSCTLTTQYTFDAVRCDFAAALTIIANSSDLKALRVKDASYIICQCLANHPELFTVRDVAGFVLQACGKPCVFIQNHLFGNSGEIADEKRLGFIDLTETRRRLVRQHESQKLRNGPSLPFIPAISLLLGGIGVGVLGMILIKRSGHFSS